MKRPLFLNIDDTHFLFSRFKAGIYPDEEHIRDMVRPYGQTSVSDLVLCCCGRISDIPGLGKESWLDKVHQRIENGHPVDYSGTMLSLARQIWEDQGLDPYKIWMEEARENHLRIWFSVRMNDCHDNDQETSFLHSNFYHTHPEYRIIRHRPVDGYYDRCLDYGIEGVRARELTYLRNLLERYDLDGLELDFQRETFCFQPGHEDPELMTGFIREVRSILDRAGERNGRQIRLAVRTVADPEDALELGFDVVTWAEESLVQVIIPSPRWSSTDTDMPLLLWKRLLRHTSVELAPCIEVLIRPYPRAEALYTDVSHVMALAAQFDAAGANAVYLYNYFDDPDPVHPYWNVGKDQDQCAVLDENLRPLLKTLGDPDLIAAAERCYMLTYRDQRPSWRPRIIRLPAMLGDQTSTFRIMTGPVEENRKLFVRLGIRISDTMPDVYVNAAPAEYIGTEPCVHSESPVMVYRFGNGILLGSAVIEIRCPGAKLDYLDVTVEKA